MANENDGDRFHIEVRAVQNGYIVVHRYGSESADVYIAKGRAEVMEHVREIVEVEISEEGARSVVDDPHAPRPNLCAHPGCPGQLHAGGSYCINHDILRG